MRRGLLLIFAALATPLVFAIFCAIDVLIGGIFGGLFWWLLENVVGNYPAGSDDQFFRNFNVYMWPICLFGVIWWALLYGFVFPATAMFWGWCVGLDFGGFIDRTINDGASDEYRF